MMLDREEVAVVAPTDDYVVEEPIVISNEAGAYKLTYELRLDPTGVGETVEPGIGDDPGIAPTLSKTPCSCFRLAGNRPCERAHYPV